MLDEGIRLGCEYLDWPFRCVGYCERDAYAAACLLARMEEKSLESSPVWCGSLEEMDAESMRGCVNLISAGFPCQPHSLAGKRKSTSDERWIWPGIVEVIRKVGPEWVFLENVPGLLSSGDGSGFGEVLRDLAKGGFDAEWCCVSAAQVGASHKRERVFILAHSVGKGLPKRPGEPGNNGEEQQAVERSGRALAHNHSQRQLQQGRRKREQRQRAVNNSIDVGHASSERLEGTKPSKRRFRKRAQSSGYNRALGNTECNIFAPGPSDYDRWRRTLAHSPHLAPAIEPGFCVLVDGVAYVLDASRTDQLRCGGNGVVPIQATVAFVWLVRRFLNQESE